jgi:hypothetical protein
MTIFIPRTYVWGSVTCAINLGGKYDPIKERALKIKFAIIVGS